jgi:hypothetical protein
MTIEYVALAIGAFLIVVIMIWKRLRFIGARLIEMQNELNELRTIESRLFMMALNADSKVEASKKGPSPRSNGGEAVAEDHEHAPRSPDLEAETSLAEGRELYAKLIALVPAAEAAPPFSEPEAERPAHRTEGRRLLQAWPLQKPKS